MAIVQDFQTAARYALPLFLAFSAYLLNWILRCGRRQANLPPGPPTIPILGNMLIFPKTRLHLKFAEWSRKYGDIFSLKIMNQTVIVLNSPSAIKEVIDRRSASSSNRPKSILSDMISPHNMNLGTGQYANETWKVLRKASGYLLNSASLKKQSKFQHAEATQLMWDISNNPDAWYTHVQRYTTSYISGITYGKRSVMHTSPDVVEFLEVQPLFLDSLEIGTAPPVDLFPFLTLVPERWAKWKRQIKRVIALHENLYGRLLEHVEKRLQKNMGNGCFMEQAIINSKEWGLTSREHLFNLGGVLLEGSDTSSATLQSAVLVLACHPEVQKKAQEEIDHVIGPDRAPQWEDLSNLPYTQAVIKECVRFRPVGPLGLPHAMSKEEVINGVLYPKDTVLFLNLWHILHDERYFDRPNEFVPERFLKHPHGVMEGVQDDPARRANFEFGGGRRVCPGVQAANSSLEINVVNFLWAFQILPGLDPINGKEIYPDLEDYSAGITATPKPAKLRIQPRTPTHKAIIDEQFAAAEDVLAPYELEITEEEREFNKIHRRSF